MKKTTLVLLLGVVAFAAALTRVLSASPARGARTAREPRVAKRESTRLRDGDEPASNPRGDVALVYAGAFADADALQSLERLLAESRLKTVRFSHPEQLIGLLPDARLLAVGGTVDDIDPLVESFAPATVEAIRAFVSSGGTYLGICGGAYVASTGWEEDDRFVDALGLAPVEAESYVEDADPRVVTVKWKGTPRAVYYQLGPRFVPSESSGITDVATYEDGSLAALSYRLGEGRVYLMGPHPEADASWIEDDMPNSEAWQPTEDLARDMMRDALSS